MRNPIGAFIAWLCQINPLCRLGGHWEKTIYNSGAYIYYVCIKCGRRSYFQYNTGYQPLDRAWLRGETNEIGERQKEARPPTGSSAAISPYRKGHE